MTDFAELDKILEDAKKNSGDTRDLVKGRVKEFMAQRQSTPQPTWICKGYIASWMRTKCSCGRIGPATFIRYMRKMKRQRTREIHWEEISIIPVDQKFTNVLTERQVMGCEYCKPAFPASMPAFDDYTKPEPEERKLGTPKESDSTS